MTTLYEYGEQLADTVSRLNDMLADGTDPSDEAFQALLDKMTEQESDWEKKALNVGRFIHQLDADQAQIKAEIDRLQKRAKSLARTGEMLSDRMIYQMTEFNRLEIGDALLSVKVRDNPPSVIIHDENAVPEQYKVKKVTVAVDKRGILAAAKDGGKIDGIEIVRSKRLAIK